jgi:hypothetical protein
MRLQQCNKSKHKRINKLNVTEAIINNGSNQRAAVFLLQCKTYVLYVQAGHQVLGSRGIPDISHYGTQQRDDGLHAGESACVCTAVMNPPMGNINTYMHEIGNVIQIYSTVQNIRHLHGKLVSSCKCLSLRIHGFLSNRWFVISSRVRMLNLHILQIFVTASTIRLTVKHLESSYKNFKLFSPQHPWKSKASHSLSFIFMKYSWDSECYILNKYSNYFILRSLLHVLILTFYICTVLMITYLVSQQSLLNMHLSCFSLLHSSLSFAVKFSF